MRIHKLAITAFVICIGAMPNEVRAGDSIGGNSTSSAGINGNQIMAGIQFGATPGSSGATEDCEWSLACLLYTSPSPRDRQKSRMPSSA